MIMAIGEGISPEAIPFSEKVDTYRDRFEIRKIVFDKKYVEYRYEEAIKLSMEFEMLYLKNKCGYYTKIAFEDSERLKMIKERFNKL